MEKKPNYCSFCGRDQYEVSRLIAGPTTFICNECVQLCGDILIEEKARELAAGPILDKLESDNKAMHRLAARLEVALTPFATQPLSTEPEFGRTRPFSLLVHDDQIRLARDALGILDPMDELARINRELELE